MSTVLHLERWGHDVTNQTTEIWCDADMWMRDGATSDVDRCSCIPCLDALVKQGELARARLQELRGTCTCGHDRLDHDWWGGGPCLTCQCLKYAEPAK